MVPRVSSYTHTLRIHLLEHRADGKGCYCPNKLTREQRRYSRGTIKTSNKLKELIKRPIILRGSGY